MDDSTTVKTEMDAQEGLTVVIPTEGRLNMVRLCLDSLAVARDHYGGSSEVIVVDSSESGTSAEIRRACESTDSLYLQGDRSVRRKRNLGVERATHDLVLFIDSDCIASESLLAEHARAHSSPTGDVYGVLGLTILDGAKSWRWPIVQRTRFPAVFEIARRAEYSSYGTCSNISFPTDLLKSLHCFCEDFPFRLGGDDVDLCIRLDDAGHRLMCWPEAVVTHTTETWDNLSRLTERAVRWGRMEFHLQQRFPNRERIEFPGSPVTFLVLLILVGLLFSITLAPLLWVYPFAYLVVYLLVAGLLAAARSGDRIRYLPAHYIAQLIDAAFDFAHAYESLKNRKIAPMFKKIVFSEDQLLYERQLKVLSIWSLLIAFVVVMVFI